MPVPAVGAGRDRVEQRPDDGSPCPAAQGAEGALPGPGFLTGGRDRHPQLLLVGIAPLRGIRGLRGFPLPCLLLPSPQLIDHSRALVGGPPGLGEADGGAAVVRGQAGEPQRAHVPGPVHQHGQALLGILAGQQVGERVRVTAREGLGDVADGRRGHQPGLRRGLLDGQHDPVAQVIAGMRVKIAARPAGPLRRQLGLAR